MERQGVSFFKACLAARPIPSSPAHSSSPLDMRPVMVSTSVNLASKTGVLDVGHEVLAQVGC